MKTTNFPDDDFIQKWESSIHTNQYDASIMVREILKTTNHLKRNFRLFFKFCLSVVLHTCCMDNYV